MRISGSSGIDVDSLVKSMMTARKVPLDTLSQKRQVMQWQRESYREINSKVYDLHTVKLKQYNLSSSMNNNKAVVTGNTTAVKAEATAEANGVPMEVSVQQLATSTTIKTTGLGFGYKNTDTLAYVDAKRHSGGPSETVNYINNKYAVTINGVDFQFDQSESVSAILSKINANTTANVKASFDEVSGKFALSSKTSGEEGVITLGHPAVGETEAGNPPKNIMSLLNLFNKESDALNPDGSPQLDETGKGQNAIVYINGEMLNAPTIPGKPVIVGISSNTFTVNGVTLTLLGKTSPTVDAAGKVTDTNPINITTQNDPDKTLDTIKSFINDYNELLKLFSNKVGEEKYRKFPPLTDEQKKAMTESDIKLWDEKAKSGLLKNDAILQSTLASLRSVMVEKLGDLSSLGITTGQYFENGKLYLDETKFKDALQKDPKKAIELFQGTDSTQKSGIFTKLSTTLNDTLNKLVDKAGTSKFSGELTSIFKEESVMGKQLKAYDKNILQMQNRLVDLESRYYKQFTAMETAMNKYNSQSASLNSFFQS